MMRLVTEVLRLAMAGSTAYSKIAPYYDCVRDMNEDNIDKWVSELIRRGEITKGMEVLELGCGTGRFTMPIWKRTLAKMVGLDLSNSMLEIAKRKDISGNISWRLGNAENLKFTDCSFDCVYMIFVLQHFRNKIKAISEVYRVLRPGGRIVIGTASHGLFKKDVVYEWFPSLLAIDLARFSSIPRLKNLLITVGFGNVTSHYVKGKPAYLSQREYVEWILRKPLSTFSLLSKTEFEERLTKFRQAEISTQLKQCFVYHQCVYVMGVRPMIRPTRE